MRRTLLYLTFIFLSFHSSGQVKSITGNPQQPSSTTTKKPSTGSGKTKSKLPATIKFQKSSTSAYTKTASFKSNSKLSLSGQWRGYFDSNGDIVSSSVGDNTEYVLELNISDSDVTGYSYSYFQNRAYYVICSLKGTYDKATKTVTVTETARIKGVTPPYPYWQDCLQVHTLTYKKEGTTEVLTGKWSTAPGQLSDCGFGNTTLTRRTLKNSNLIAYNKSKNNTPFSSTPKVNPKSSEVAINNIKKPKPTPYVKPQPKQQPATTQPAITTLPNNDIVKKDAPVESSTQDNNDESPATIPSSFEKRNNDLLKTVTINNETFRVDLYDNGIIDGDSISLFFNGKLILSHQRLSDKAITLTLNVNTNRPTNDLTMYAENLGDIPPNTALMVVSDGENRYEVPIKSDLKNSGTIRFVYKPKSP